MAKANNNERTEREFQLDVNAAVANTENEIFDDALGDEPLDNDGDTSLEEMGEGLEGDDLEEQDEEETEEKADDEGGEEEEEAEGEEAEAAEGDETAEDEEEEQPRDQQGRFEDRQRPDRRDVPLRAERDRRREAEERSAALERQVAEMNGRLAELSARANAPRPQVEQPKIAKPDQFADPEGWEKWHQDDLDRKLEERTAAIRESLRQEWAQQQQQIQANVVEESLGRAANGPRKWEFKAAYGELLSRDKNNPQNQELVNRIYNSRDPEKTLFEWWDEFTADADFRLTNHQEDSRQRRQQPRHETRLPESLRRSPPSLNSARGGQRQETNDPEMMDDSDEAVARYAFRR